MTAAQDMLHDPRSNGRDVAEAGGTLRLLIVDDEDADRVIVSRSLARCGLSLEIEEAATPAEALRRLHDSPYDCVFVDERLPGADAAGLFESTSPLAAQAVVFLTGGGDDLEPAHTAPDGEARNCLARNELGASAVRRVLLAALEKAQLRRRLEKRQAELAESRRELVQFARTTSRDLRQPLGIVVSYLQRLERRCGDNLDERSREYMKQIVDVSMRMQQMVGSLLELTLVGHDDETFEPCAIDALLAEALTNLQAAVADSGATVDCEQLPTIVCSRHRIVQLLHQLLDNAIRYRGPSQPAIRLSARPVAVDAAERLKFPAPLRHQTIWQFDLEDNGPGVSDEDAERLFAVFQRGSGPGMPDGTGMGLAFCRRIVELHRGRIWVEAREEGGSRFCFTLPSGQP